MSNYLDTIFTNKKIKSDSESSVYAFNKNEYKKTKKNKKRQSRSEASAYNIDQISELKLKLVPTGGFPPIYFCKTETKNDKHKKENDGLRSFSKNDNFLSIREIMESKNDLTPFVGFG